ncbi:hypothetical protein ACHAXA_008059, partial [Cyclostephanos tholiformis]
MIAYDQQWTISFFSQLVFDPTYLTISLSLFPEYDWSAFYGDINGAIPSDMPDPLGNDADDSDHAEEKRTKCFQNGSSIFCNRTLGAAFVALQYGILRLRGLWYYLCLMGIPLSGPSYTSGDYKSHVTDLTKHESTLKRKCTSLCHYFICESMALGESAITHLRNDQTSTDLTTH